MFVIVKTKRARLKESYQFIGFSFLHRKAYWYELRIPDRVWRRSETGRYRLCFQGDFAKAHYMEEVIIKKYGKKMSHRIERYVDIK